MQTGIRVRKPTQRPARKARSPTTRFPSVRDIMSSPVEFLEMGDSLDLAQRLMAAGRIRHLPVVDGQQRLIGLVTHRKLLAAWVGHGDPAHERPREIARAIPVDMLMETNVLTIRPDAPAAAAARLIEREKIGCLPVVESGKLVGIVTEADFVHLARKLLERSEG
jgi:CBS domain-containing membrane protein